MVVVPRVSTWILAALLALAVPHGSTAERAAADDPPAALPHALKGAEAPAAGAVAVACQDAQAPVLLAQGEAVRASVPAGGTCHFRVPFAEGTIVRVTLSQMADDFDLYARRLAPPTFSAFDCRPFIDGLRDEICDVPNAGGDVFVMVFAFAGSGGFTLHAITLSPDLCDLRTDNTDLDLGVPLAQEVSADRAAMCFYRAVADGSSEFLLFTVQPARNDLDVAIRPLRRPTFAEWECVSALWGLEEERCALPNVAGLVYYALVVSNGGGGAFTIAAEPIGRCGFGDGVVPLTTTQSLAGYVAPVPGASCTFAIAHDGGAEAFEAQVDARTSVVGVTMAPGPDAAVEDRDCDAFADPSRTAWCFALQEDGTSHLVVTYALGNGRFSLAVAPREVPELVPGEVASGAVAWGRPVFHKLPIPPGTAAASVVLTPSTSAGSTFSDLDLFTRAGALPRFPQHDCGPERDGSVESCVHLAAPIPAVPEGLAPLRDVDFLYVMVDAFSVSGGHYELRASVT